MKRANLKTYTYHAEGEWMIDVIDTGDMYWAYLHQGVNSYRKELYGMPKNQPTAADIDLKTFVKYVGNVWEDYIDMYEEEVAVLDEYYDRIEAEYDPDHDDDDDECDCEHCAMAEANKKGLVLLPELEGAEVERKIAGEIREGFIKFMGTDFRSKYTTSVTAFVNWYVNAYTDARYWIAYKDSFDEMFFIIDRIQEWRNAVA